VRIPCPVSPLGATTILENGCSAVWRKGRMPVPKPVFMLQISQCSMIICI
jgi:hypothetical protein